MATRIVQAGKGAVRDVVVLYHLTAELDGVVRGALGPAVTLINVTEPPGALKYMTVAAGSLQPLSAVLEAARQKLGLDITWGRVALVGYSEGCQALRAQLLAGATPDAIVAVDGTHGDWPHRADWQVKPYRDYFLGAQASQANRLFVASHSGLTYVEQLRPTVANPRLRPYASTKRVLEEVTGWRLDPTADEPTVRREGRAVVYSYVSHDHAAQARRVLPRLLAEELMATWNAESPPAPAPSNGTVTPVWLAEPVTRPMTAAVTELPAVRTPATFPQMATAFVEAWATIEGVRPTDPNSIRLLLAHWAHETGNGKAMWNHNIGNIKGRPGGSDGRSWTFFPCNELLPTKAAIASAAAAKPRTDGKPGPNAVVTKDLGQGTSIIWFYPSHPGCCFRAYRGLAEGAVDYLALLKRRFTKGWAHVVTPNPRAFSAALREQGYYTATLESYTKAMEAHYRAMQGVLVDLEPPHPEDPEPAPLSERERTNALSLAWLTMRESVADIMVADRRKRDDSYEPEDSPPDEDVA